MGAQDEGQIGATVCPALYLGYISAEMAASLWPLCLHDFTPLLAFPQTANSDVTANLIIPGPNPDHSSLFSKPV